MSAVYDADDLAFIEACRAGRAPIRLKPRHRRGRKPMNAEERRRRQREWQRRRREDPWEREKDRAYEGIPAALQSGGIQWEGT